MILDSISELSVVGVFERGVPNEERIVLYANETVNLGQYGLMLGVRAENGFAFPIRDNLLWFGDGFLNKGDWIFVYTGPGEAKVTPLPNTQEQLYSIHWGKQYTVLDNRDLVPILFRVDAVNIPHETPRLHTK